MGFILTNLISLLVAIILGVIVLIGLAQKPAAESGL